MGEPTLDLSLIPQNTHYCYGENGVCPYWSIREDKPSQRNGYCEYLKQGDWEVGEHSWDSLLWDQCKECGISLREITEED